MQIRNELKIWMVIFLSIYLLMTFGTIQLLSRMTPAIEHILQENVYSVTAVEDMLTAAADRTANDRAQQFQTAFKNAQNNITEPEERTLLSKISQIRPTAFEGDNVAMSELLHLLNQLGQVNRESMEKADEQAKRLGRAGAWAVVILGFTGFLISLYAMRRLARRFLEPLEEIHSALQTFQKGEKFRRCTLQQSSPEFRDVGNAINQLFEKQWSQNNEDYQTRTQLDRLALLNVIDKQKTPMCILDTSGHIHAANKAMDHLLTQAHNEDIRAILLRIADNKENLPQNIQVEKLKTGGWLCTWSPPEDTQ